MARREVPEINAGSMADIAFLLLIFWLVTTTIDSDEGVKRQLPPPVPPDMEQQEVKEGDVFNVRTNFRDELLVESEVLSVVQLKDGAKDFLIATGTGLLHPERPNVVLGDDNMKYPERQWVRKSELLVLEQSYLAAGQQKGADRVREKLTAIELFGGDYRELPGSALISLQTDRNTSYDLYLQVQNELEAAVNELRDELSLAKFNESYASLEERYGRSKEPSLLDKIKAVRLVYPQRISEAEPRDASQGYY
ncbi:MAG: biopolymer transporter ExbD [Flavobacteriales bacterium]|nr:biopolymer transporter ExbD [Flavobacteriales bacterium]